MGNLQKATLEALLARKEQAQADKMQFVEVDVPSIGMTFTVERLPITRFLAILEPYQKSIKSLTSNIEMYKDLIYKSVPIMQSKQLHEAYAPKIPSDIVTMILEDNLTAIGELGDGICEIYGIENGGAVEAIKN